MVAVLEGWHYTHAVLEFTLLVLLRVYHVHYSRAPISATNSSTRLKPTLTLTAVCCRHPVILVESEGIQENVLHHCGRLILGNAETSERSESAVDVLSRGPEIVLLLPAIFKDLEEQWRIACVLQST